MNIVHGFATSKSVLFIINNPHPGQYELGEKYKLHYNKIFIR